jgi:hypothetical protein
MAYYHHRDNQRRKQMNGTTTPEAQVQSALRKVEEAIADLGYPRINPESLTALRDALDEDEDWLRYGPDVRRAYRVTMAGFQALLAPKV